MTAVSEALHPAASHHLPSFITAPGETDVLMVVMGVILIVAVVDVSEFCFFDCTPCRSELRIEATSFSSRLSRFWA